MGLILWLKMVADDDTFDFPSPDVFAEERPVSLTTVPDDESSLELSPDDIAEQLELYCHKANGNQQKLMQCLDTLQKRDAEIAQLKTTLGNLQPANTAVLKHNKALQTETSQLRGSLLAMQQRLQGNAQISNARQKENDHLQGLVHVQSQKLQDIQLDLEFLKCTKPAIRPAESTCFINPQPFVAVLVDGDAYGWSNDIIVQSSGQSPGALAAIRLKAAVTRSILDNSIHPSCKVTAKVYLNGMATVNANTTRKPSGKGNKKLPQPQPKYHFNTFGAQFAGAIPLFDIIDVGYGKERADEKIRENFHLLISNPLCHAIFLAAATDNGFARMLSPYQYNREAYDKVILVSPGYVEGEIANLGFRDVTWPSVFQSRSPPPSRRGALRCDEKDKKLAQEGVKKQMALETEQSKSVALVEGMDESEENGHESVDRMAERVAGRMLGSSRVEAEKRLLDQRRALGVRMMSVSDVPKAAVFDDEEWEDNID